MSTKFRYITLVIVLNKIRPYIPFMFTWTSSRLLRWFPSFFVRRLYISIRIVLLRMGRSPFHCEYNTRWRGRSRWVRYRQRKLWHSAFGVALNGSRRARRSCLQSSTSPGTFKAFGTLHLLLASVYRHPHLVAAGLSCGLLR